MTSDQVATTSAIANRSIYVEQAIRRIKTFKMLQTEILITLVHVLHDLFFIASALWNMRCPLSK